MSAGIVQGRSLVINNLNDVLDNKGEMAMDVLDLIKEGFKYVYNDCGGLGMQQIVSANMVTGTRQECDCELFDHEYVDQECGISGDDFSGFIYLPLPGNQYAKFHFAC